MVETENPTTPAVDTSSSKEDKVDKTDIRPEVLTKEDLTAATAEAVQAAIAEQKALYETEISKRNTLEEAQNQRLEAIARAATGQDAPDPNKNVLEAFVRNPTAILGEAIDTAKRQAVQEVREEMNANQNFSNMVNAEVSRRQALGLTISPQDSEAIVGFYKNTDENLPAEERFQLAVKKHDDYVESLGLGDFETRVKAASSVSGSNASAPGGSKESSFNEEAELKKEMEASSAHYDRAMNISN